jgi:hypothetical protein
MVRRRGEAVTQVMLVMVTLTTYTGCKYHNRVACEAYATDEDVKMAEILKHEIRKLFFAASIEYSALK